MTAIHTLHRRAGLLPLILAVSFISTGAWAGKVYHCKDAQGKLAFQDRPCKTETVKVDADNTLPNPTAEGGDNTGFDNSAFKASMRRALAKMGKSEQDLNNPKVKAGIEILAKTDAAKSYAFTKIYGVAATYCGANVKQKLDIFNRKAKNIIGLGEYYYTHGITSNTESAEIKKRIEAKGLKTSGKDLTQGLNTMLQKLHGDYKKAQSLSPSVLANKCSNAARALDVITAAYQ